MKRALGLGLALLASLAGCAAERPYAPVRDVSYTAIGAEPFWLLTIGDGRIVLSRGERGGRLAEAIYPRVMARRDKGATVWESGEGVQVISIEARPQRCEGARGIAYEDRVRIRLSGAKLHGCGGRIVAGGRGR
jgi:uncharacterized membrane protein